MADPRAARLRAGLEAPWFDRALGALIAAAWVADSLYTRDAGGDLPPALIAIAIAIGSVGVAMRRRFPLAASCVVGAIFLAEGIAGDIDAWRTMLIASYVLIFTAGAQCARGAAVVALVVLAGSVLAGSQLSHDGDLVPELYLVAPWFVGRVLRSRRRLVAALAERTSELETEQDAFARLAVRRERARVARELHDIVAHNIAVMVIQAGAGRVATDGEPGQAADRFASIRDSGRQALDEMTRLVDVLHIDDDDTAADAPLRRLDELLTQARAAGLEVRSDEEPLRAELPQGIEEAAFRAVQEGLTNALKHAPGADVTVRLAMRAGALEIEVHDDGARAAPLALRDHGSNLGLTGMRERVDACGGELHAGPDDSGGWRLRVRLPVPAG